MSASSGVPVVSEAFEWLGGIKARCVHHVHVIVEDVKAVQKALVGARGVDSMTMYDIGAYGGCLALMVRTKPVAIEYLQVTHPEIGLARLIKDDPLGLSEISLLVDDIEEAIKAAKELGYILLGRSLAFGCREAWLSHPVLKLNIEFMMAPPADYKPSADEMCEQWIYGHHGDEEEKHFRGAIKKVE